MRFIGHYITAKNISDPGELYTLMAALTFPLGTWYAIPPGLFLHLVFVAAAKKDPFFWDVFRRAFLYRHFYRG